MRLSFGASGTTHLLAVLLALIWLNRIGIEKKIHWMWPLATNCIYSRQISFPPHPIWLNVLTSQRAILVPRHWDSMQPTMNAKQIAWCPWIWTQGHLMQLLPTVGVAGVIPTLGVTFKDSPWGFLKYSDTLGKLLSALCIRWKKTFKFDIIKLTEIGIPTMARACSIVCSLVRNDDAVRLF